MALFDQTSFSPSEQQVILLAISAENHCSYCVAAHSMIAKHMVKADPAIVEALRDVLRLFTKLRNRRRADYFAQ